jgi:AcrR family transcriptional regulator
MNQVPARERILETAARLFLRDGFRAVGVDTIVAEAGVAKMTLYAHFPSKDDLIVAYLERANQQFWAWLEGASGADGPRAKLLAMFDAVGRQADSPQCLGCTFQGTAAEFPDPEHPGHRVALAHKQAVLARLRGLAEDAGLRAPADLAQQLLLLMDGAWVAARMFGPHNPGVQVAAAARALIRAHDRQAGAGRTGPEGDPVRP